MNQQPRTLPPIPEGFWCEHKDARLNETPFASLIGDLVSIVWTCNFCHASYSSEVPARAMEDEVIAESHRSAGRRLWERSFKSARESVEKGEVPKFGMLAPPRFAWNAQDLGKRKIVRTVQHGPYLEIHLDGSSPYDYGCVYAPSTIDLSGAKWKKGCKP